MRSGRAVVLPTFLRRIPFVMWNLQYRTLLFVLCGVANGLHAQRYATEVFSDAQLTITPDVPYGVNIDFQSSDFSDADIAASEIIQLQYFVANQISIPLTFFDPVSPSTVVKLAELRMDMYEPDQVVDCEEARPLFIYLHTGDLLPPPLNGRPIGTRKDSSAVEICRMMARRGYVAASLDYRLGWEGVSQDPDTLRSTWINALYRAMHDLEQGIRDLKFNAPTYHLSAEKVIICGEGIGGSIALSAATLNDFAELFIEKLLPDPAEPGVSYVDTTLAGNLDGFNGQNNLYRPNGYSSDFNFCVSIGGALVDTSWLAPGDVPMISMHAVFDPFMPLAAGTIINRIGGDAVIPVHGPELFQAAANTYGNNVSFTGLLDGDPYTDRARDLYGTSQVHSSSTVAISDDVEGLFPFVTPDWPANDPALREEDGPWTWWDPNSPEAQTEVEPGVTAHEAELAGNANMAAEKGRAYIDTIMGYINPRIIAALALPEALLVVGLPCDDGNAGTFNDVVSEECLCAGIPDAMDEENLASGLRLAPNPVRESLRVTSENGEIRAYDLFDATGRRVRTAVVKAIQFTMDRSGLEAGTYFLSVRFADGCVTRKVALH